MAKTEPICVFRLSYCGGLHDTRSGLDLPAFENGDWGVDLVEGCAQMPYFSRECPRMSASSDRLWIN
jgi:hypothetical protein